MKNPTFIELYADGLHFLNLAKLFAINITMTTITFFFDEVREVTIDRYSYGPEKFEEMRKKVVSFLNTGSVWEEGQEANQEENKWVIEELEELSNGEIAEYGEDNCKRTLDAISIAISALRKKRRMPEE